jgi:hypothetical protein
MQNVIIKVDKIKTKIPYDKCFIPKNTESVKTVIGLNSVMTKSGIIFEFSGKLFATSDSYGYLTKDNLNSLPEKIFSLTGIQVDSHYLLNQAPIYRVDVCNDVIVEDIPSYYISETRQILKSKSNKYTVQMYKDFAYKNAFAVVPDKAEKFITGVDLKTKTLSNFKATMYIKGVELNKTRNREYRQILSYEKLQEAKQTIRFELQLRKYKDMRKVFNIHNKFTPTLNKLFECKKTIIADFFDELIS